MLKDLISGLPVGSKVSVILTDGCVWQHTREGFLSDEFGVDWAKAIAEARYGRDGQVDEYWGCQIQYMRMNYHLYLIKGEIMKKILKIIGITILFISMAYASNWDLPKEENIDADALNYYQEHKDDTFKVRFDGQVIEGQYIEGMWYEALEMYGGVIPDEYLEHE